jgi:hypothetical protein
MVSIIVMVVMIIVAIAVSRRRMQSLVGHRLQGIQLSEQQVSLSLHRRELFFFAQKNRVDQVFPPTNRAAAQLQ